MRMIPIKCNLCKFRHQISRPKRTCNSPGCMYAILNVQRRPKMRMTLPITNINTISNMGESCYFQDRRSQIKHLSESQTCNYRHTALYKTYIRSKQSMAIPHPTQIYTTQIHSARRHKNQHLQAQRLVIFSLLAGEFFLSPSHRL